MEKSLARISTYIFHPLIMTTLGMFILLNSGTSLSVIQPEVKRITIIITALFTFVFPASMIIMLYLMKVIRNIDLYDRQERILPIAISLIMYFLTFFVMKGIPQLSGIQVVYLFCPAAALFLALFINNFIKPSIHMLGIGIVIALLLVLILFYGARIQLMFIIAVFIGGILGSARLILNLHSPIEILMGFLCGFLATFTVLVIFIL